MSEKLQEIREAAESSLLSFIHLVAPQRMLGGIHEELISWWCRQDAKTHQLVLLPRGHQKSMLIAYRVAWEITRNPATTILYISSTANLAEKQLKAVQDILTSAIYSRIWPEMVAKQEGKRERWTTCEISVDHPLRKTEGVRDPTVFTAGLTSTITGMHCDIAVMDDVVVKENAYTQDGRNKVREAYSLLSSIENPDAREWIVGTRYHPRDLYQDLMEMEEESYDSNGELIGGSPVYEVMERQVEDSGDGCGEFIWPRQRRKDGRWYGFDQKILARKKAQYLDKTQFRAQYYNDPNDPEGQRIGSDKFQYYERKLLVQKDGYWWYNGRKLNVFAAIDFAFSLKKGSDYTALVILGVDCEWNYYVLHIDRFKTDKISEYFKAIFEAYKKWEFRKIRCETTVAQKMIVNDLKDNYIKPHGLFLSIDEFKPGRSEGSKEERMQATLEPRYDNMQMWHYKGGNCQTLEEELVMAHPPHDDVMDALTAAIDVAVAPSAKRGRMSKVGNVVYHDRFGGVSFA
jgi:phage terminase large subunit-like protein